MDMDMDMATMDTMARGLLRPSLDMVIMVMDMVLDMVMDMVMDTMDIMARGLLMLSQAMDITVMDMVMDMAMDMDMVMAMAMVTDTTAKLICCSFSEFSTNEVGPYGTSQKHTIFISQEINIEK